LLPIFESLQLNWVVSLVI